MRILDMKGEEVLNPNYDYGYTTEERIFKQHHDAVEAVDEQFHYEVIREYPNGGKDVQKVIDVPGVEAADAWDEYETILRWHNYTDSELADNGASWLDRIDAQVTYTAMMTDTLLTEG